MRADADDDRRALSAFRDAAAYERGRPGWPDAAVDRLCAELGVGAESVVVDLAAGTGKLTRSLVSRAAQVVAIEPSAPMLDVLRTVVPQAEALAGDASALPLADGSVQAVFVAEAFHWFGSPEVVAEIARVVTPGGGLALLWNDDAMYEGVAPPRDAPGRGFPWGEGRAVESLTAAPAFGPVGSARFAHEHALDADAHRALVASYSWVQAMDAAARDVFLDEHARGAVDKRYVASVYWAVRR